MDIRINGELIDIANGDDITMQYKNYRFSGVICDQFSTELELPRTRRNEAILGAYIMLDNRWQQYGRKIECSCSITDIPEDGYLQVTTLTNSSITATLFLSLLPIEALDKTVSEILRGSDDSATILPWDRIAHTTVLSGHTNSVEYSLYVPSYGYSAINLMHTHSSMRLQQFLNVIGSRIGVTMPSGMLGTHRIVAPNKFVCPENNVQVIAEVWSGDSSGQAYIYGGQHVCNDAGGWNSGETMTELTFNRDAVFDVDWWARDAAHIQPMAVQIYRGGNWVNVSYLVGGGTYYRWGSDTGIAIYAGEKLRIVNRPGELESGYHTDKFGLMVAKLTYTSYQVGDDDYENEMQYPENGDVPWLDNYGGAVVFNGTTVISGGIPTTTLPRISFAYFGYYTNCGEYSVRNLLTSLVFYTGIPISVSGRVISWSKESERSIVCDGDIIEMSPLCDSLARHETLRFQNEEYPQEIWFDNEFMADDAVLHESVFQHCGLSLNRAYNGLAGYYQYRVDVDVDDGGVESFHTSFEKLPPALLKEASEFNPFLGQTAYYLMVQDRLHWMGIDELGGRIVEVVFQTFSDLRGYDYFYYEGRKYMIEECDYNTSTGVCTATALEVYKRMSV